MRSRLCVDELGNDSYGSIFIPNASFQNQCDTQLPPNFFDVETLVFELK